MNVPHELTRNRERLNQMLLLTSKTPKREGLRFRVPRQILTNSIFDQQNKNIKHHPKEENFDFQIRFESTKTLWQKYIEDGE